MPHGFGIAHAIPLNFKVLKILRKQNRIRVAIKKFSGCLKITAFFVTIATYFAIAKCNTKLLKIPHSATHQWLKT